jgi:hypothetical protein
MTPEVKQMIANEVKNQIALENSEAQQTAQNQEPDPASSGVGRLLAEGHHVFVAGSTMDVVDTAGVECVVSDGDVLELEVPLDPDATVVNLMVLASKGGRECKLNSMVSMALTDVQAMQNHMRESVDQGLEELASKQGKDGLPAAPPSAKTPPVETAFARSAPPPDPSGAADIDQQLQQSEHIEQQVIGEAGPEGSGSAIGALDSSRFGPPTISVGQSIAEVTSTLGPPQTVIDLGARKIYKYKDMKVIFNGGKVTNVE